MCAECQVQGLGDSPDFTFVSEYTDSGRYEFVCPKGHKTVGLLQNQRFEILFDIGAFAILDGYYREAVTSFSASLERFFEFYVFVSLLEQGLQRSEIREAWKQLGAMSERQLGAYCVIFLQRNRSPARTLSRKSIEFRNDVVHKGKIPSRAEAIEFGQHVMDIQLPALHDLKVKSSESLSNAVAWHLSEAASADKSDARRTTFGTVSLLGLVMSPVNQDPRSLLERLNDLHVRRALGWA